jgi:Lar family restriction alleviation protein
MTETIRCYQCKWLRTDGPCDQWYHWCGLDEGAPPYDRIRRWHERAGNADMYSELDGTCDRAERKKPKLKPCPFCGSEAAIQDGIPRLHGYGYGVGCSNPDCIAYSGYGMAAFEAEADAIGAWNRRYGR